MHSHYLHLPAIPLASKIQTSEQQSICALHATFLIKQVGSDGKHLDGSHTHRPFGSDLQSTSVPYAQHLPRHGKKSVIDVLQQYSIFAAGAGAGTDGLTGLLGLPPVHGTGCTGLPVHGTGLIGNGLTIGPFGFGGATGPTPIGVDGVLPGVLGTKPPGPIVNPLPINPVPWTGNPVQPVPWTGGNPSNPVP